MKYFIDCGAHCGESILGAKQTFGEDTIVISFEPVPYFAEQLNEIYKNDDTVKIENAAVWINDDIKKFYIHKEITDGSSLLALYGGEDESQCIDIPCFDLSLWVKNTFTKDDYLILKLDIEGAEYEVLNKMIDDGTISMINELWGEWHHQKVEDEYIHNLANKIQNYLTFNNIIFNIWELHIPTLGKSHPKLAYRPKNLRDVLSLKNI
jgi:FkbM family methyltransferase